MDELVLYADTIEPDAVEAALPGVQVRAVYHQRSLVEALTDEPRLIGAVVEVAELTGEWTTFLESARELFPMLPILVLAPGGGCLDGLLCFNVDRGGEEVARQIADYFAVPRSRDRRSHHRFDWPLTAKLDGEEAVRRVCMISAGGARLERVENTPLPGTRHTICVRFGNFTMTTSCEILDPRHVSSGAGPGFGVRFDSLSESAEHFIDRVVGDALVSVLLDPNAVPEVPSIDDDDEMLEVGDEFSISL